MKSFLEELPTGSKWAWAMVCLILSVFVVALVVSSQERPEKQIEHRRTITHEEAERSFAAMGKQCLFIARDVEVFWDPTSRPIDRLPLRKGTVFPVLGEWEGWVETFYPNLTPNWRREDYWTAWLPKSEAARVDRSWSMGRSYSLWPGKCPTAFKAPLRGLKEGKMLEERKNGTSDKEKRDMWQLVFLIVVAGPVAIILGVRFLERMVALKKFISILLTLGR